MKICVYSDIHGNLESIQNLMKTKDYKTSDLHVFLGDAVAMCPFPNECMDELFSSKDIWLMGNHDSYMAFGLPEEEYQYFKADKRAHQDYMRNLARNDLKMRLRNLPKDKYIEIGGKTFYFTHYLWESDKLIADELKENNSKNLDNMFQNVNADYIIFGHEHRPFYVKSKKATYVCVGSLGMKYPGNYVVIEIFDNNKVKIRHKKISFNVENLKRQMLEMNYPRANGYSKWFDEK